MPLPDPRRERGRRRILLAGEVAGAGAVPPGCRFHTRCPRFVELDAEDRERCLQQEPVLAGDHGDHQTACHYAGAGAVA